jgi:hypothetical protein
VRVEAASTAPWVASRVKQLPPLGKIPSGVPVPSRLKVPVGPGELSLRPMMWMFLAILLTFLLTRTVTRLIRSGSGTGAGLGNVRIAGNHVHHQVFGILIIIGTGIALISATPRGAALDAAAAVFGAGVGLTVDEFALWLHLEDVYWTDQGRKSVDAIFCVLVITGALIGGASFATGHVGTAAWWSSIAAIAVNLVLCVICLLKGKVVTGVIGIFIGVVAVVGAVRLAKPGSWWAVHRYARWPRRAWRAASRYDQRYQERWNRLRDLVAGAPSRVGHDLLNLELVEAAGVFGKSRLSREGAEAEAVVTSAELYQEGMRANWGTGFTYDVGMRVHFEDGTTAEIVRRIGGMAGTDLKFNVGDIVPVRYDPRNRGRIELDEDALRASQGQAREELQRHLDKVNQQAVRDAEAKLAKKRPPHHAEGSS